MDVEKIVERLEEIGEHSVTTRVIAKGLRDAILMFRNDGDKLSKEADSMIRSIIGCRIHNVIDCQDRFCKPAKPLPFAHVLDNDHKCHISEYKFYYRSNDLYFETLCGRYRSGKYQAPPKKSDQLDIETVASGGTVPLCTECFANY